MQDLPADRQPQGGARPCRPVYALELAGEDDALAAAEAGVAAEAVRVVAPGLALAATLAADRLRRLALVRRASRVLAEGTGGTDAAVAALEGSPPVDAGPAGDGSVAVRAVDLRGTADVDTPAAERALGAVLDARGHTVDLETPDHVLRALFAADRFALGWEVASSHRDYGDRRPTDRPFFQPGVMSPLLARTVANLALGSRRPERTRLLDPMCGTGGVLTEAGLVGAPVLGSDAQPRMVEGTRENLAAVLDADRYALAVADATRLPLPDDSVGAVALDVPYGRQSRVAGHDRAALVAGALRETARVAPRAAVVADRPLDGPAADAGLAVQARFERRVHRSLTRHVHVLERSG